MLLEAATFDGPAILDASLALGLRTESSARFEKGLPRELPPRAMAIAGRLLVELAARGWCPARSTPWPGARAAAGADAPRARAARAGRRGRARGVRRPSSSRLGCAVDVSDTAALTARVPFERGADLTREIDLIEEVGRIHGLDGIPAEMPRVVGPRAAHARPRRCSTGSRGWPPTSACPRR